MKKLQEPITAQMMHAVATLTAAGVSTNAILRRSGVTPVAMSRIQASAEWPDLLASKAESFARMMRGDA